MSRYKITVLSNEHLARARITSVNQKCLRIEHKGRKLYVPILPVPSGDKIGHIGWRTRTDAEQVYDATAACNKIRVLRANGLVG